MPYIPSKEEEARAKKWKKEKEEKDFKLNSAFGNLTSSQMEAIEDVWKALYKWDNEIAECNDCFASTERNLRATRWKLYHAFPNVTQRDEEDDE